MRSIRRYLIIVMLSCICLVNFLAALHGYQRSMVAGEKILDQQLEEYHHVLQTLLNSEQKIPPTLYGDNRLFQVWQNDQLLVSSLHAPDYPLTRFEAGYQSLNFRGVRWRVLATNNQQGQWIVAGQRYELYSHLIEDMVVKSILPIIWVLPFLGIIIWVLVSYGVSPLKQLAQRLQSRSAANLQPLDEYGYPQELTVVVSAINTLMLRLDEAFVREQRFTGDAAHELRTPLTALKLNLHNVMKTTPEQHDLLLSLSSSVERMENSIEQMLALSRLTPEKFYGDLADINFTRLTQQVIIDLYSACEKKKQQLSLNAEDDITLQGDAFALQTLLKNLIDNAIKYTPTEGVIEISLREESDINERVAVLTVEDSGEGIDESEYSRIFNRFYRVGGDRHNSQVVGSGLGLSMVKHIVDLHQGAIVITRSMTLGGLSIAISLPIKVNKIRAPS